MTDNLQLAQQVASLEAKAARKAKRDEKTAAQMVDEHIKRHERLVVLQREKNPQIQPDTLRNGTDGELINGKPHKGWVVTIKCEVCGAERWINTQDAFQVKFCVEHSRHGRRNRRIGELTQISKEDLRRMAEELKASNDAISQPSSETQH